MESFTEQLRRIDDAELDVYQFRLIMHYWRVGKSWESLRTTAKKCNISLGKAHETRQWLIDNGWVKWQNVKAGKRERLAIVLCSPDEQCSPHEQKRSPHEQIQQENVHHMNAYLNEPLILNEPHKKDAAAKITALIEFWCKLTGRWPKDENDGRRNYGKPAEEILERVGWDLHKAKQALIDTRKSLLAEGRRYMILESIKPFVFATLDGFQDTPAGQSREPGREAWQRVLSCVNRGRWELPRDGPEMATLNKIADWSTVSRATDKELDFIGKRFLETYENGQHG